MPPTGTDRFPVQWPTVLDIPTDAPDPIALPFAIRAADGRERVHSVSG